MCQHMFLEVTSLCEFVLTLLAAERLFSGMNKNVLFQTSSCCEREGTNGANKVCLPFPLWHGLGGRRHHVKYCEVMDGNSYDNSQKEDWDGIYLEWFDFRTVGCWYLGRQLGWKLSCKASTCLRQSVGLTEGKSDIIAFIMSNYEMKKWKVNQILS